ncbi:putative Polyadenylate-binding protein 4 [Monocercomonoides exilis]|uniref:putative Polyadenylate-binding protein 4 n=1 Tax=Monocercomonoides exilis TaxID=2049356 RepID=UPI003559B875|nr:putative Polyadenylate-binding protein 4 [Monocercomonoides exilis]|eukprot:MONOS_3411.1-p1 / transcript=MONOS_3411.1 / gene=MONOS_3411 / organism=Monocercomonoides_exilis_PA203 / gene_product=Polyadenylate-binding protein 4 / transcript_product=Polyadenylate-binding protein 4 / location=Mono_scaffold00080:66985-69489(+) / protein_length=834 / sequence_SO=supercontig / SO=protein_coding / is_pseudo=false
MDRQYSLFIGDLHESLTQEQLEKYFQEKLPEHVPTHIKICRDHNYPYASLRYGYLNFQKAEDAAVVLEKMNYSVIQEGWRPVRMMWYQSDPSLRKSGIGNIFIKNLPPSYETKKLHDLFSDVGTVMSCRVSEYVYGTNAGAHGYVQYQTKEDADKAIAKFNGTEVEGRTITVEPSRPPTETVHKTVYVTNFLASVNEERLAKEMEQCGKVTKTTVQKSKDGLGRIIGFVWFEEQEQAEKCVKEMNGKEIEGFCLMSESTEKASSSSESSSSKQTIVPLKVSIARSMWERMRYKKQLKEATRFRNLYVRGFPAHFTDDDLKELFSRFGKITSAKVMKSESSGISRGFGFVCFSTDDEARKAYLEMNGVKVPSTKKKLDEDNNETEEIEEEKELYVNYCQTKEERTQYLLQRRSGGVMGSGRGAAGHAGAVSNPFANMQMLMSNPRFVQQMMLAMQQSSRHGQAGGLTPQAMMTLLLQQQRMARNGGAAYGFGAAGRNGMSQSPATGAAGSPGSAVSGAVSASSPSSTAVGSSSPSSLGSFSSPTSTGSPSSGYGANGMLMGQPGYRLAPFVGQNSMPFMGANQMMMMGGRGGVGYGMGMGQARGGAQMGQMMGQKGYAYGQGHHQYPNQYMYQQQRYGAMPGVAGGMGQVTPATTISSPSMTSTHTQGSPLPGVTGSVSGGATGTAAGVGPSTPETPVSASSASLAGTQSPPSQPTSSVSSPASHSAGSADGSGSPSTAGLVGAGDGQLRPLTIDSTALADMSVEEQKQHLGEALFPQIQILDAANAGKITGMLLELETTELITLVENVAELKGKVKEAQQVLFEAQQNGQPVDE